jgi:hypothetical protein
MTRGLITIANEGYDCSHLDPFIFNIPQKVEGERGYRVLVSFSHHTFTRSFEDGVDPVDFLYVEHGDRRCFCQDRYLASKTLPNLIKTQSVGKAFFAQKENFMLLEQPYGGAPYAVFFSIEKARGAGGADAVMFVMSAYEKPNLPPRSRLPSISFRTLVHKKVRGEKIVKPKK